MIIPRRIMYKFNNFCNNRSTNSVIPRNVDNFMHIRFAFAIPFIGALFRLFTSYLQADVDNLSLVLHRETW